MDSRLVLRKLTEKDEDSFIRGATYWDGEEITWYAFDWKPGGDYSKYLETLFKAERGVDIDPKKVASSMLYAFVDGEIVGRLSVRHTLNDWLARRGGHIGYSVAPKFRNKSYGKEILKQGLEYCRSLKMSELLITCSCDNLASRKLIEANQGVLSKEFYDKESEEEICHYLISL